MKQILEEIKEKEKYPVIAAIAKPYKGIRGIKRSYEEAKQLFALASMSGASAFTVSEDLEEKTERTYSDDTELLLINAVRRNHIAELKEVFIQFVYGLPKEEEQQFQNYYSNLQNLNATKAVNVCYRILNRVIEVRKASASREETKYFQEYMSVAVASIEEHLEEEALSIVTVADHVYLNPVYFGRVFKNTFQMTFKKCLYRALFYTAG